jgi:hypothetical protein
MTTMLDAQLFLLPQWVFAKEQAPFDVYVTVHHV